MAVYDFGRIDPEDGVPTSYIVMEHVDGPSLSQMLTEGPLGVDSDDDPRGDRFGLYAAHRAGVVHRDVKPGNIIMAPSGHVKLTDFGIAQLAGHINDRRLGFDRAYGNLSRTRSRPPARRPPRHPTCTPSAS